MKLSSKDGKKRRKNIAVLERRRSQNLLGAANATLEAHGSLDLAVEDEDKSRANSAECVSAGTLEESAGALLLQNLDKAINSAAVEPLGLGLLGLHLETTADGVEGVRGIAGSDGGGLGDGELGGDAKEALLVLVGVNA